MMSVLCVRVCRREEGLVRRCEGTADRGCVEAGRSGSLWTGSGREDSGLCVASEEESTECVVPRIDEIWM